MVIGFIGLGKMGLPMAKNLLHAGFAVHAYNRSIERTYEIQSLGGKILNTADAVTKEADIVVTMLADDAAVSEVSDRIVTAMKAGSTHVSMSTISPATAIKLSRVSNDNGINFLSAPVLGRPPAAEARQLFILLAGSPQAKEKVQPILQVLGQRIFDFGDNPPSANTVKLIMNYMIFVITEMLSETMLVAEKTNLDKQMLLDTMLSTLFGAPVFKTYGTLVVQEKENINGFATTLASKDLRLMQETASVVNMILPLGELIQKHFREIIANNQGSRDISQLITHLRNSL